MGNSTFYDSIPVARKAYSAQKQISVYKNNISERLLAVIRGYWGKGCAGYSCNEMCMSCGYCICHSENTLSFRGSIVHEVAAICRMSNDSCTRILKGLV